MSHWFDFGQWNNFLNEIKSQKSELENSDKIWYRGVHDQVYTLIPSLFRYKNGKEKEGDLFNKYKQISSKLFSERKNDWEVLFDMQHHYIPTRLLDWTEVLGVAVFFALLNNIDNDAAIYILDPLALNKHSSRHNIPMINEDKGFDYKEIYWDKKPLPPNFPIAIEVPSQSDRILAQRGKFTIHGDNESPIEKQFPDFVRKVVLSRGTMEGATEFLKNSGINEFSMFPDIIGLAPFIKNIVDLN